VANLINKKAHLTTEGLNQIRMIRKGMNKGRIFCVTETETASPLLLATASSRQQAARHPGSQAARQLGNSWPNRPGAGSRRQAGRIRPASSQQPAV
jgi:hypothetical protein